MRKTNKNLNNIPISLKPPTEDYFPSPSKPIQQSYTTHQRRAEVIDAGVYINENKYNERYKYRDVKEALFELYHKKCAFCEQRVEVPHVEHFRPKSKYYWLAYSWDNLLLACAACNTSKNNTFDILGLEYNFVFDSKNTYTSIHSSCAKLDSIEQPLLVNPETEDLSNELVFNEYGEVCSNNIRLQHTITTCGISRDDLCYQRKKIIDDFRRDVEAILLESIDNVERQRNGIEVLIGQFTRRAKSNEESFLTFRKHVINNKWLNKVIKYLN